MKVISVIGNSTNEGNSTTVFNLGNMIALADKKTLIIDADLRKPMMHKMFNIKNKLGLSDILTKKAILKDVVLNYSDNLDVVTSGTIVSNAADLLQSSNLKDFFVELKKIYDVILLDCSPIKEVTDGIIVSNYSDGTLLVIACNNDDRKDLICLNEEIKLSNTNVIGMIMTKMPNSKN